MRGFRMIMIAVVVVSVVGVVAASALEFKEFQGPTEILWGPVYTYSVLVEGEYDEVAWSATGGTVKRDWWDDNRYFCEVQWSENKAEDPAKLKVYGQGKGSDEVVAERLFVNVQAKKRSLDFRGLQNVGGRCLDLDIEDLVKNGGRVQVWECNAALQQRWKMDDVGRLVNEGGKCLDVHAPDLKKDGGKVQVWDCGDVPQQKWKWDDQKRLVNEGSGKCLETTEITQNGALIQIWGCSDSPKQKWQWID